MMSGNTRAVVSTVYRLHRQSLFQSHPWKHTSYVPIRCLSVSETAVALRPFFFMVHPDLFGKFPKEQAINEQSLKLLNEYIEKLHSQQEVRPVSLIFYVRKKTANRQDSLKFLSNELAIERFRSVQLLLTEKTLPEAVRSILAALGLPLDYVNSVKPQPVRTQKAASAAESTLWQTVSNMMSDKRYKQRGFDFFYEFQPRRTTNDTLVDWLRKNVIKAHKRNLVTLPVRQDIRRMKETLQEQMGVTDVRWESNWAQASFRTALRGLLRICDTHSAQIDLEGRTVVFGNDSGVCIRGNVILRYDSVPESWISVLTSLHKLTGALNRIPSVEQHLSTLLNDVQIVSRLYLPVVPSDDYLCQLQKLIASILDHRHKNATKAGIHVDLDGVELVVDCATGPLAISQSGQILVPSSCPAFLIFDYINSNAYKARDICKEFKRCEMEHRDIVGHCHTALGLESLTSDSNITRDQMVSCCRRLLQLNDGRLLDVDLTSCRLRVTNFYSVMSEGDICIPWNFDETV